MDNCNKSIIEKHIDYLYKSVSNIEYNFIKDRGVLIDKLYQSITTTKYRRSRLMADDGIDIRKKITNAVEKSEPIEFSFPFGGCKLWQFNEFPQPDWAEFFNLLYMVSFLKNTCCVYEPGAVLTYSSGDVVMNMANNIPEKYPKEYISVFKNLLSIFNQATPTNLHLDLVQIKSLYSEQEFNSEYKLLLEKNRTFFSLEENQPLLLHQSKSAQNNFLPKGINDYSEYTESDFWEIIKDSAIKDFAFLELSKRRKFNKNSNRIQIVNVNGPSLSIHLGSCMRSTTQFWVGVGVCELKNGKLSNNILSKNQLSKYYASFENEYVEVDTFLNDYSDNFKKIRLFYL